MKYHRFIGNFDLNKKKIVTNDQALITQIKNVLRLGTGDALILSDGQGMESEAVIENISKNQVEFTIKNAQKIIRGPEKEIILYCSILKRENFELITQKATEVGVSKIVPVISARTVKTGLNMDRLQKIILEAAEQSGRTTIPELLPAQKFVTIIEELKPKETILFDGSGEKLKFNDLKLKNINLLIGPEGGWQTGEVIAAKEKGMNIASLGDLTLRGETAAIVVSFLAGFE